MTSPRPTFEDALPKTIFSGGALEAEAPASQLCPPSRGCFSPRLTIQRLPRFLGTQDINQHVGNWSEPRTGCRPDAATLDACMDCHHEKPREPRAKLAARSRHLTTCAKSVLATKRLQWRPRRRGERRGQEFLLIDIRWTSKAYLSLQRTFLSEQPWGTRKATSPCTTFPCKHSRSTPLAAFTNFALRPRSLKATMNYRGARNFLGRTPKRRPLDRPVKD